MKKLISFFLVFMLIFSNPISVFASSIDSETESALTSYEWFQLHANNFILYLMESGGVILNPDKYGEGLLKDRFIEYLADKTLINNVDSMEEYINSHMNVVAPEVVESPDDIQISVDNTMMNDIHNFALQYIEEESPFWVYPTADINDYIVYKSNIFQTNEMVSIVKDFISSCSSTTVFYSLGTYTYKDAEDVTKIGIQLCLFDYNDVNFVTSSLCSGSTNNTPYVTSKDMNCWRYDSNWESTSISRKIQIDLDGNITESEISSTLKIYPVGQKQHYYKAPGSHYYYFYHWWCDNPLSQSPFIATSVDTGFFTSGRTQLRMYKSLDDLKQYSLGSRPYYMTSDFYNYNSSIDNSTTITQTEIDNSVTYGDVYNYIINNYDNPDGLTEEELRAILEEYLSQIGGGSGGSGSGDDSGGGDDGGGGLSGFLDGLGAIGNAILAILGKLMEILGSAIELVTGSITDLITIIPNSIGELLGALFPVFPEEWIKAITLSLVLGVIVGIVRIFK